MLATRHFWRLYELVRIPNAIVLFASLCGAAYLGFSLLQMSHDKLTHFATFLILTAQFYFLWNLARPWKLTVAAMTVGASIGLEYLQNWVNPARKFDPVDILYNISGSALAVALCIYFTRDRSTYGLVNSQDLETV